MPFRGTRKKVPPKVRPADTSPDAPEPAPVDRFALNRIRLEEYFALMQLFKEVMTPGTFFCGETAAYVQGAPIDPPANLNVGAFAPQRAPRSAGTSGRKVEPHLADICEVHGLPMTTPASTWALLGGKLSVRELVKIGDAFVQIPRDRYGTQHPEQAATTIDELRAEIDRGKRPGIKKLRAAIELIRVGMSSPLETDYRLNADAAGLPTPVFDMEVFDDTGRRMGISEFVYTEYLTIVEVEGDHHRTEPRQWDRDMDKYYAYEQAGWRVVRLSVRQIRGSNKGILKVAATLRKQGWDGVTR